MKKNEIVNLIKEELAKNSISEGNTYDQKKIQEIANLYVQYLMGDSKSGK